MKKCKCGSFAVNIDDKLCDVCYWKEKYEQAEKENAELGKFPTYREMLDWIVKEYDYKNITELEEMDKCCLSMCYDAIKQIMSK